MYAFVHGCVKAVTLCYDVCKNVQLYNMQNKFLFLIMITYEFVRTKYASIFIIMDTWWRLNDEL